MTVAAPSDLGIDPGLTQRFRAAGARIAWRAAEGPARPGRRLRVARLDDEEAVIDGPTAPRGASLRVESGPVGALCLVLEADRRGALPALSSEVAGPPPGFSGGAIIADWGRGRAPVAPDPNAPRWRDVVDLARYALR